MVLAKVVLGEEGRQGVDKLSESYEDSGLEMKTEERAGRGGGSDEGGWGTVSRVARPEGSNNSLEMPHPALGTPCIPTT